MSAISESMNRRMTLGLLASRYGFDLDPTFATEVTITSIADDIDSVRPGSLFMPSAPVDACTAPAFAPPFAAMISSASTMTC